MVKVKAVRLPLEEIIFRDRSGRTGTERERGGERVSAPAKARGCLLEPGRDRLLGT